jgi:hypothetical protein
MRGMRKALSAGAARNQCELGGKVGWVLIPVLARAGSREAGANQLRRMHCVDLTERTHRAR